MSAVGGRAEDICSAGAFQLLTHSGSRVPSFEHNVAPLIMFYDSGSKCAYCAPFRAKSKISKLRTRLVSEFSRYASLTGCERMKGTICSLSPPWDRRR